MVRRRLTSLALGAALLGLGLLAGACGRDRDMMDRLDMPDTMTIMNALQDESMRDSMLDMMPGGEMVRGDSAAVRKLLDSKR